MKSVALFSSLALSILPFVAGHGYIPEVNIDGKSYKGPNPGRKSSTDSVIRQVTGVDPSYGADNKNLNCGPGAQPAKLSAPANPGSTVSFTWHEWTDGRRWPHNTGDAITYMAKCDGDCSKFDSSNAKWFKIDEKGRTNGKWAQETLYENKPLSVKIPETLAPGNYLIMHQLISLHLATKIRGAEFYASCTQLKVGGNQKGAPSANELVSMPGAYSDNDKGIFVKDLYNAKATYVIPGPPVAKLAATSSDPVEEPVEEPETPAPSGEATPSESAPAAPKPSSDGGSCRKPKKEASIAGNETQYKARHLKRVKRTVAHDITA